MLQLLLITAMLGNVTIKNTLKHACMYMKHDHETSPPSNNNLRKRLLIWFRTLSKRLDRTFIVSKVKPKILAEAILVRTHLKARMLVCLKGIRVKEFTAGQARIDQTNVT